MLSPHVSASFDAFQAARQAFASNPDEETANGLIGEMMTALHALAGAHLNTVDDLYAASRVLAATLVAGTMNDGSDLRLAQQLAIGLRRLAGTSGAMNHAGPLQRPSHAPGATS